MEAPTVPTSPRNRFVRDYSTEALISPLPHHNVARYEKQRTNVAMSAPRPATAARSPPLFAMRKESFDLDLTPDVKEEDFGRSHTNDDNSSNLSSNRPTGSTAGSVNSRILDFFSDEIFQLVLHDPTTAHHFAKFARSRLCGENFDFLDKVNQYHQAVNRLTNILFDVHKTYISVNAPAQVNLAEEVTLQVNRDLKSILAKSIPPIESIFVTARHDVEQLVASDIYPRYIQHQMNLSTTRALASNKNKYAGLGDCFVLTDPSKADNPIVCASDGFVRVTGYLRNEIVPRNCRFLQSRHTDAAAVTRLREAIAARRESVELILNERKNGEPFWNLLYVAPLFDAAGHLVFFLGGQINISTTIHSKSDMLRILSSSEEDDTVDRASDVASSIKPPRQSFFRSFRSNPKPPVQRPAGMESDLLEDMGTLSLQQQRSAFYTAYSKYIIVNASSRLVAFYSRGITELLYPVKTNGEVLPIAGQDVFKFLASHTSKEPSRDYKSSVKNAMKMGQAISLEILLCTRRLMGFEKFASHWTPLKGEGEEVKFVILTLGSINDF